MKTLIGANTLRASSSRCDTGSTVPPLSLPGDRARLQIFKQKRWHQTYIGRKCLLTRSSGELQALEARGIVRHNPPGAKGVQTGPAYSLSPAVTPPKPRPSLCRFLQDVEAKALLISFDQNPPAGSGRPTPSSSNKTSQFTVAQERVQRDSQDREDNVDVQQACEQIREHYFRTLSRCMDVRNYTQFRMFCRRLWRRWHAPALSRPGV